ncbi:hypothetical protein [Azospirillum largimobile]
MVHWYDQARLKRQANAWQDGRCARVECRVAKGTYKGGRPLMVWTTAAPGIEVP